MKVLIVEDDEDSRILLEFALGENHYEILSAENGKIALELTRKHLPDIIISDILMPEMDGYSLCKAIMSDKTLCHIPFIFYTATYTEAEDKQLALNLGATKFLVKPMEIESLLLEIQAVINNHCIKQTELNHNIEQKELILTTDYANIIAKKLNKKVRDLEKEREQLSKSESKYRRLVEALRDNYFFYTHDSNAYFTYTSPSIQNVLGYTQEEFQQHFQTYLTDNGMNSYVISKFDNGLKGIVQHPFEIEIFHKNGRKKRLYITEQPILNKNGNIISVEGIAQDITRRIMAEKELASAHERLEQAQKMEAIGNLAGGIAHDFNNILMPIFGYIDMIKSEFSEGSKGWEWSTTVQTAATRAKELVQQILTFSRCKEQEKKKVYIQSIAKEVIKFLQSSIPKSIEIRQSIYPVKNPICANPIQMHQVLMNLCTNAYHAMREKGGILAVSLSEIDISSDNQFEFPEFKEGTYIRIEVSDTGSGIKKEHMKKIFEPYFTTKSKNEGTGLGLSVVHGIITNHDGHIFVYSEPEKGTTFLIYIPVIQSFKKKDFPKLQNKELNGTERLLIIEDDDVILELLKKQLTSFGYQVVAISCPVKAFEIFSQNPQQFDLVISDMTMPKKNGISLAQDILSIRPDIPIVLCTGFSELINKDTAIAMGVKDFIMKPMSKYEMGKVVRDVLDADEQYQKV
jgi:PAS domain S-box-containing protein